MSRDDLTPEDLAAINRELLARREQRERGEPDPIPDVPGTLLFSIQDPEALDTAVERQQAAAKLEQQLESDRHERLAQRSIRNREIMERQREAGPCHETIARVGAARSAAERRDEPTRSTDLVPSSRQSQGDAAWDTRDYANLPGPVANTRHTVFAGEPQQQDGHLPFDGDALRSSQPPENVPRFEVGWLPSLEPEASHLVPCSLLSLWDDAGMGTASPGRGGPVPVARRIGMEVLLAVPPDARMNEPVTLHTTMAKLSAGIWPATKYVPRRHGPLIEKALHKVNAGKVTWRVNKRGAGRILVFAHDWPGSYDRTAVVGFTANLPPGSR